jgi:hypothetical protein
MKSVQNLPYRNQDQAVQLDDLLTRYRENVGRSPSPTPAPTIDTTVYSLQKELEREQKRNAKLESFYKYKPSFDEVVKERDEFREKNLELLNNAILCDNLAT